MKYQLIVFFIFCVFIQLNAQENGNGRIGFVVETYNNYGTKYQSYGLRIEYFVCHSVSLNYKITIGSNTDRIWGHVSIPVDLGLESGAANSNGGYVFAFIPEGVGFHIYPNEWFEISPYIDPIGCEKNMINSKDYYSCAVGLRLYIKPSEKLSISPNLGLVILYTNSKLIANCGLTLAWQFEHF